MDSLSPCLLDSLNMKQGGEDIAMAVLGRGAHLGIGRVAFLVRGLGLFPTSLWTYLRGDKGGCSIREIETAGLRENTHTLHVFLLPFLSGYLITECNVVVTYLETDVKCDIILVLEMNDQHVSLIVGRRCFGTAHGVSGAYS